MKNKIIVSNLGKKMIDGRKRRKCECGVLKVKISNRAVSTDNLHRHIRTVHPSVQLEEKKNKQVNLLLGTSLLQLHHHNHLDPQPRAL